MRDKIARDRLRNESRNIIQPEKSTTKASSCLSPVSPVSPVSPPTVTRITIPNSPLAADRPPVIEDDDDRPANSSSSGSPEDRSREEDPSFDDSNTPPPADEGALDELWRNLRHKKEKRMTKDKCKVDSLKARDSPAPPGTSFFEESQSIDVPAPRETRRKHTSSESARDKPPSIKRQKSV
jgi:hypothetical protein